MTRGLYAAATGMMAEDAAQQVIAQNLANASTTGYKQDVPEFQSFDETLVAASGENGVDSGVIGAMGHGAQIAGIVTDLSDGPVQSTGNSLDVALRGSAYLQVRTNTGQVAYSRDGALTLNAKGTLVQSASGYPVLSSRGRMITIPSSISSGGDKVTISPDGSILAGNSEVDKLGVFSVTQANIPTKIGDNLISVASAAQPIDTAKSATGSLQSGYLEASNVSVVKEMVSMIACMRSYEANAKALQSQDDMQNKSITQVGGVTG